MKNSLCLNCGHPVHKVFCPNCGQKSEAARLKWSVLADGFVSTFIGDGAIGENRDNIHYGLLLTLWSIATRPGATVTEYLEGRRRKYFKPVTILLLLSGFYALLASAVGYIVPKTNLPETASVKYFVLFADYCNSHPAMWYLILLGAQAWFSVSIYRALFAVKVKRAVWSWIKVMTIS